MTEGNLPRTLRRATLLLASQTMTLVGLCALCLFGYQLFLRPILANFDSRYASRSQVEPIPFDRDLWQGKKARHRVGIASYLANKKLLDGKTRSELVEMLGEPDVDRSGDEGVKWVLGFEAGGHVR